MTVGCVIAALAPNIPVLFVGRVVQGVSGPVVPLCLIMLRHEVQEPKRYGTLMGVVTAVNGGVAGVDALAGGYLASSTASIRSSGRWRSSPPWPRPWWPP